MRAFRELAIDGRLWHLNVLRCYRALVEDGFAYLVVALDDAFLGVRA